MELLKARQVVDAEFPMPWYGGIRRRFDYILGKIERGAATVDSLYEMLPFLADTEAVKLDRIIAAAEAELK